MINLPELPSFLSNEALEFILFGGKGGTGKTTCAAAAALHLAKRGRKTLIFSTDPAHSLSDSFDVQIGNKITPINENLDALEVKTNDLIREFNEKYELVLTTIADRGTYLDIDHLVEMFTASPLPGMDEFMAMLKIMDIRKERKYDLFILDTAPTGHTLRLLQLPKLMDDWVVLLDTLEEKYRYIVATFKGRYEEDSADKFIGTMRGKIKKASAALADSRKTEFVPVTIPEAMGVEETKDLIAILDTRKMPVRNIIINRVIPSEECELCTSRKADQEKYVQQIKNMLQSSFLIPEPYNVVEMPLLPTEIRGIHDLTKYSEILAGAPYVYEPAKTIQPEEMPREPKASMSDFLKKERRLILFGGKGGVGKTTAAAATAIYIARKMPDKKVLVFSTDPAHSLSDSFDLQIGDRIAQIEGFDNLHAIEMAADEMVRVFKEEYMQQTDEALNKSKIDLPFDREVLSHLKDLSPAGMGDMMALSKVMELMNGGEYDLVILDTAPTGHTVRLLESPARVMKWFSSFARLLYKYRHIAALSKTVKLLLKNKESLMNAITCLKDSKTEFIAVTIPEEMAIAETERLLEELHGVKIPVGHVFINGVIPPTQCSFCTSKRREQLGYIEEIGHKFSEYTITEMPLFPHEVRGIEGLTEYAELLYKT